MFMKGTWSSCKHNTRNEISEIVKTLLFQRNSQDFLARARRSELAPILARERHPRLPPSGKGSGSHQNNAISTREKISHLMGQFIISNHMRTSKYMYVVILGIGTRVILIIRLLGCRIRPPGWRSREDSTSYRTCF